MASKETTTLYVRNMVCPRCIRVVRDELAAMGLDVRSVALGEVVLGGGKELLPLDGIRAVLEANGFGIVEDRKAKTIEKARRAALKLARHDYEKTPLRMKDSDFISKEVGLDYRRVTTLFSQVESVTIEQYVILQRIEYAKELLKYGELTLSEISWRMGYSSAAHLSTQFKKVTGMTPTAFRAMGGPDRRSVDAVAPRR
jgi:AraC family transcriptional regulator